MVVVYFDQRLGAGYPKPWSFLAFCAKKLKNTKINKFGAKFSKKGFLSLHQNAGQLFYFQEKEFFSWCHGWNAKNGYFDQCLGCAAPKCWSKYTTYGSDFSINNPGNNKQGICSFPTRCSFLVIKKHFIVYSKPSMLGDWTFPLQFFQSIERVKSRLIKYTQTCHNHDYEWFYTVIN